MLIFTFPPNRNCSPFKVPKVPKSSLKCIPNVSKRLPKLEPRCTYMFSSFWDSFFDQKWFPEWTPKWTPEPLLGNPFSHVVPGLALRPMFVDFWTILGAPRSHFGLIWRPFWPQSLNFGHHKQQINNCQTSYARCAPILVLMRCF